MLKGMTPPVKEALCPLMRKAATLNKEDLTVLTEALQDPRWTSGNLATELTNRGFEATINQITKHRSKVCACAR